ncbi:MAG: metal ABC transporter ATP-binding protein [Chloroflexi bacterium]|nr:metal ABC transporter ATP-binding protein [Chloroflexota bacterium]
MIDIRGLRAGYADRLVFDDLSFEVQRGELIALIGANGSGKSTLLKVIAGVLPARAGSVQALGAPAGRAASRIAYLPQAEQVRWDFPLLAEEVVLMGRIPRLGVGRRAGAADRAASTQALERVGAQHLRRRLVSGLSGGERQRILVARALAADPELLLLDEPATGVDPTTEEQMMAVLEELARGGKTVLVSTHDLGSVLAHFPRVVCMNGGIVADGSAELLRDADVLRRTYGGHAPADAHH